MGVIYTSKQGTLRKLPDNCLVTKPNVDDKIEGTLNAITLGGVMKKLSVFPIVFLLGTSLSLAQETVPSQIKEVTLFTNQALVKREAKAKFHKGLNELLIELQAFRVERDSVSAKVFGDGEIYSVQFKEVYLKESPQENIKALERNIKELKDSKRILLDEKDVLQTLP